MLPEETLSRAITRACGRWVSPVCEEKSRTLDNLRWCLMSSPEYRKVVSCATKPKVTLGVCVRNSEESIKKTIESILVQDYPHEFMELIFVDDGSQDNTLSIVQGYMPRIDLRAEVFHTSWKGTGHARNIVAVNAHGDFILWVDGDMTISSNYVRKLVGFMDQHREVGIAKGRLELDSGESLLSALETYSRGAYQTEGFESRNARSKSLGTAGAIYRIAPLRRVGGFDKSLKGYCEDWDVEIKIRDAGWSLRVVDAECSERAPYGLTWRSLWNRYLRRGYFTHYFLHKRKGLVKHYRWLPPAAFFYGLVHACKLFKLLHKKSVFLLPLQYVFKMTAYYVGFFESHLHSYQPKCARS